VPTNIQVLLHANQADLKKLSIITKPVRSISGVSVVTIMTKPIACPHGKCSYCPGGIASPFGDVPQSYTGNEPASMRAARAFYDPYLQVFNRLEQYIVTGHEIDKIEMIVNGGTFTAMPIGYQESFVASALKALNDFSNYFFTPRLDINKFRKFFELPGNFKDAERVKRVQQRILQLKKKAALEKEQKRNETAKARCVALCLETRPDWCREKEISNMLRFGATRVEIGVQSIYDKVLKHVCRGHDVNASIKATQMLKDSFLKVCYHIMPGLPLTTKKMDTEMFRELFTNSNFRPDALKIYPTMVMPGTKLYDEWKKGRYKPLTTKEAAEIIAESKKFVPEYCRIMRVQRDIPTKFSTAGVDRTNLRQYVNLLLLKKKVRCNCIRCREPKNSAVDFSNVKIKAASYESSGGEDSFIAAESDNVLLGFCRLRMPYKPFRKEITAKSAGIRELHVYGKAAALSEEGSIQHRGIGKKLLAEAEKIARERYGCNKMLVISGIGAREYYRKLGYRQDGPYVSKKL
ncbi:MAG: tRNA uridine(34) 5-carboxymethylaminomethyl modification radical SAM/GNAT enzyme Elp3, partial [Candidatus Woesearchaeota archaeon]